MRPVHFVALLGLAFGVSFLTKIVALLLPVLLVALLVVLFWQDWRLLRRHVVAVALATLVGLLVFYVLYPAAWRQPWLLLDRVGEVEVVTVSTSSAVSQGGGQYLASFVMTDLVLCVLAAAALAHLIWQWRHWLSHRAEWGIWAVIALYGVMLIGVAQLGDNDAAQIVSIRYVAPIVPLVVLATVRRAGVIGHLGRFALTPLVVGLLLLSYAVHAYVAFLA